MKPSDNTLQLIHSAPLAELPLPSLRRVVFNMKRAGQYIPQIARKIGRNQRQTEDLYEEAVADERSKEFKRGFTFGRRSLITPPPTTQRRAA